MIAPRRVQYVEPRQSSRLPANGAVDYWAFNTPWRNDDNRLLVLKWTSKKVSVSDLADRLGRTPGSLYAQAQKLGLPLRRGCSYHCQLVVVQGKAVTVISSAMSMRVDNVRVLIRPTTFRWRQPWSNSHDEKPVEVIAEKDIPQTRLCLGCHQSFRSSWIGNRMCSSCLEESRQML